MIKKFAIAAALAASCATSAFAEPVTPHSIPSTIPTDVEQARADFDAFRRAVDENPDVEVPNGVALQACLAACTLTSAEWYVFCRYLPGAYRAVCYGAQFGTAVVRAGLCYYWFGT